MIGCVLCAKFKATPIPGAEKIKRNERLINNVFGKAWLVVNGVNIWKPHLLRAPRKSSLNIETVEVCLWARSIGLSHGPDKMQEAH